MIPSILHFNAPLSRTPQWRSSQQQTDSTSGAASGSEAAQTVSMFVVHSRLLSSTTSRYLKDSTLSVSDILNLLPGWTEAPLFLYFSLACLFPHFTSLFTSFIQIWCQWRILFSFYWEFLVYCLERLLLYCWESCFPHKRRYEEAVSTPSLM